MFTEPSQRALQRLIDSGDQNRLAKALLTMARMGEKNPLSVLHGHPLQDEWMDFAAGAVRQYVLHRSGTVYVVANPVHVNLYKVGVTKGPLEKRLRSLKTAGVVGEFIEIDQVFALDRFAAERLAHHILSSRVERHKEFFVTDYQTACAVVRKTVEADNSILERAFRTILLEDGTPA